MEVLLFETPAGRPVVARASGRLRGAGVCAGMDLGEARALGEGCVGDATWVVERYDTAEEYRHLVKLGRWAMRFTPRIALDEPDGLLFELAGLERHYESEGALLSRVVGDLERLGLTVRAAVASTVGCAWAVARFGPRSNPCVPTGEERVALEPLPVEALRLEAKTAEALRELSVERVEQLLALERKRLASRFGGDLAHRIDQALGQAFEVVEPLRYERVPESSAAFQSPVIRVEGVLLAARRLMGPLLGELERGDRGVLQLNCGMLLVDGEWREVSVNSSRATLDAEHLMGLLERKLEHLTFGAGVERMGLRAVSTAPLSRSQVQCFDGESRGVLARQNDGEYRKLVDALSARLGHGSLREPRPVESHVPERAFVLRPYDAPREEGVRSVEAWRPSRLFARPEAALFEGGGPEDELPDRFRWRGRWFEVCARMGPEIITRPWWDEAKPSGQSRRYWQVRTDCGRSLWVFRGRDGALFVHGEWA